MSSQTAALHVAYTPLRSLLLPLLPNLQLKTTLGRFLRLLLSSETERRLS